MSPTLVNAQKKKKCICIGDIEPFTFRESPNTRRKGNPRASPRSAQRANEDAVALALAEDIPSRNIRTSS